MRGITVFLGVVAVVGLAGCGTEAPRQAGARVAVQESLPSDRYVVAETRCTPNPRPWFIEQQTDVFICVAHRRAGGCDWYRATLKNAGWDVAFDRKNADCILPF